MRRAEWARGQFRLACVCVKVCLVEYLILAVCVWADAVVGAHHR